MNKDMSLRPKLTVLAFALVLLASASATQAVPITLNNPGFDAAGGPATGKDGFTRTGVIGWQDAGNNIHGEGGVYVNGSAPSSPNVAYAGRDDPGAFQLTNYVIQPRDVFTLTYHAASGYKNSVASVRLIKTNATYTGGGPGSSTKRTAILRPQ